MAINIKQSLGTKVGPLPMAAWAAIVVVGLIIYSSYRKRAGTSASTPNGTGDVTTTLPIGYTDANGNPIVPGWTTLPENPPEVDTTVPGNGGTVSSPPTGTVPPATLSKPKTTHTPVTHTISGSGHGKAPVVKGKAPVPRPHVTSPTPVSHRVTPTHAATASRPAMKPVTRKAPVKAPTHATPLVNRKPVGAPALRNFKEGIPAGEHSGSRIGDLAGAKPAARRAPARNAITRGRKR